MKKFTQDSFNKFVIDNQVVGFFDEPIKLSSGRISSWYVNWRRPASDVHQLDQLTDYLLAFCQHHQVNFDCFYGTPDGATKLAVIAQYKWAKQQPDYGKKTYLLPMGRKSPKEYGDPQDRFFIGAPTGKVVVLEDVTTTSGSLLKTIKTLQELKIDVVAAIALTSRNAVTEERLNVADVLNKTGVRYLAMSNAIDLLPIIDGLTKISPKIRQSIIDEFDKYGERQINF